MIKSAIKFILGYSLYHRLVFICILVLLLSSLVSICLSKEGQTSSSKTECDEEVTYSSPIANQPLALRRYRMLKQVERRLGIFPLLGLQESRPRVFFPRGKGDKVYVYAPDGWNWLRNISAPGIKSLFLLRGYKGEELLCFISRGDDVKLLYGVKLKRVNYRPPKRRIVVRCMFDYISTLGDGFLGDRSLNGDKPTTYSYAVSGHVGRDVKRDLSLKQELVLYKYIDQVSLLTVQCFSTKVAYEDLPEQLYEVAGDVGSASEVKWFKTYGLPLADCELPTKSKYTGKQR